MNLRELFATNKQAETEGVWVDVGKGIRIKIARYENPHYVEALRKKAAPHRAAARAGVMSDDMAEKVLNEVIAETILLDWDGVKDKLGNVVPYSRKEALAALNDMRDFRDLVLNFSKDLELFKLQQDEADEKNCSTSSAGS